MDNEEAQELFDLYHAGEMELDELMETLELGRFDGDVFDYL